MPTIDTVSTNTICVACKLVCKKNGESSGICCNKCFNWYHQACAKIIDPNFKNVLSKKFRCNLCTQKTNCHSCARKYYPRSLRVNCVNCENSFCSKCAATDEHKINFFLTPENDFYCQNCDQNFLCNKCAKPCENSENSEPSILCDSCKKWTHFRCSKLSIKQFNKYGRTSDLYYCTSCIGASLPFSTVSKNKFFGLNVEKNTHHICDKCQ